MAAKHRAEKNAQQTVTTSSDQTSSNSTNPDAAISQDDGAQIHVSTRTTSTPLATPSHADPVTTGPSAVSSVAVFPSQLVGGQGMAASGKSSYHPQQGFSSAMGGQGVAAGRNEGGGLMMASHNPSAPAAVTTTPSPLSSALNIPVSRDQNMVSHDQDDSVFSPSSVDDERMKLIEQVSSHHETSASRYGKPLVTEMACALWLLSLGFRLLRFTDHNPYKLESCKLRSQ